MAVTLPPRPAPSRLGKLLPRGRRARFFLCGAALACAATAALIEARFFHPLALICWLASLVLGFCVFRRVSAEDPGQSTASDLDGADWLAIAALLVAFAPIYLFLLYWIPVQMNTDEIVIANISKAFSGQMPQDILGPSEFYFGVPTGVFAAMGYLARALGGVDLYNMRLVHAALGIIIIVPAYAFFRLSADRPLSIVATMVLMSNHALVMISRTISRNNLAVLNVVVAFLFLLRGVRRGSRGDLFVGGVACGLAYYHYPPARVIFPLWLLFLVVVAAAKRTLGRDQGWMTSCRSAALVSGIGFALTILPMSVATWRSPPSQYSREQLLVLPEGREHQRAFYAKRTVAEAYRLNVHQAATMFNRPLPDQAGMYWNVKAGFLDVVSGWMLWIGLAAYVAAVRRGERSDAHLLAVVAFIALWLMYAFVMNKAPNYTRLFLILPFVAQFVARGLDVATTAIQRLFERLRFASGGRARALLLGGSTALVVLLNLAILAEFALRGFLEGNDLGSTARYVEARRGRIPYSFYIVSDQTHRYYEFEYTAADNCDRLRFSASSEQGVFALRPAALLQEIGPPPWSVLMPREIWSSLEPALRGRFRSLLIHHVLPDGSLVAVESP